MKVPREPIPEEKLPVILARAAELDRATISWDAIRQAALDAGISSAAVDQALEEYASGKFNAATPLPAASEPMRQERWWRRAWRSVKEPLTLMPIAFALGLIAGINDPGPVAAWVLWVSYACFRIWRDRPARRALSFSWAMTAIGFGLLTGMGLAEGDEDAMVVLFMTGLTALALGIAMIKIRLPRWMIPKRVEA